MQNPPPPPPRLESIKSLVAKYQGRYIWWDVIDDCWRWVDNGEKVED